MNDGCYTSESNLEMEVIRKKQKEKIKLQKFVVKIRLVQLNSRIVY